MLKRVEGLCLWLTYNFMCLYFGVYISDYGHVNCSTLHFIVNSGAKWIVRGKKIYYYNS